MTIGPPSRRDFVRSVAAGAAALTIPRTLFARPPFEPTGWRTVWLDYLSYRCADYERAAAFYSALMGWKIRSDDGTRAVLEIGENSGDVIFTGGLTAPPPAALTDASPGATHARAIFDGFAWGIAPWNTDAVHAALDARGLSPVAAHDGDYKAFSFKDPDGFSVRVSNATKAMRRKIAGHRRAQGCRAVQANQLENTFRRPSLLRSRGLPAQHCVL